MRGGVKAAQQDVIRRRSSASGMAANGEGLWTWAVRVLEAAVVNLGWGQSTFLGLKLYLDTSVVRHRRRLLLELDARASRHVGRILL